MFKRNTNSLFLVVEGTLDGHILRHTLDFSKWGNVYMFISNGKLSMASYIRTAIQMMKMDDKLVACFDSDVTEGKIVDNQIKEMRNQSHVSDLNDKIGIFAFVPNIETALLGEQNRILRNSTECARYINEHKSCIASKTIMKQIQSFID